jgi:hypothetical protein
VERETRRMITAARLHALTNDRFVLFIPIPFA